MILKKDKLEMQDLNGFLEKYVKYLQNDSETETNLSLTGNSGNFLFYCYALEVGVEGADSQYWNKLVVDIFHYITKGNINEKTSYWNGIYGMILMFEVLDKSELIDSKICSVFFDFDKILIDKLIQSQIVDDEILYLANTLLIRLRHYQRIHDLYVGAEIALVHVVEIIFRVNVNLLSPTLLQTNQIAFLTRMVQRGLYVQPIIKFMRQLRPKLSLFFESETPSVESINIMLVYSDYLDRIGDRKALKAMKRSILSIDYLNISYSSKLTFEENLSYFIFLNRLIRFYHVNPLLTLSTFISNRLMDDRHQMLSGQSLPQFRNGILNSSLALTTISFYYPNLSAWDTVLLIS